MRIRLGNIYVVLTVACVAVMVISLAVSTSGVSSRLVWKDFLLPRLLMGMLAGASLSMAGAMFQALFRNPLASPYTLGVSAGASFAAAITIILFGGGLVCMFSAVSIAAFLGALGSVTIVYLVAHLKQHRSIGTLLLAGITIGFICNALIVLVLCLAEQHNLGAALRWMMGSLQVLKFDPVLEALPFLAPAVGVALYLHRDLDLMMMGEQVAAARGVPVRISRRMIYFSASLMTAAVVAQCGPIGFVGLIVPHSMRFFVGPTHRRLLPACALAGAAFLPLCDLLARNAMWWLRGESRQLPVGVLTNLIGGVFFLVLLLRRRGDRPIF